MLEKIDKIKPLVYSIELRDPYTKGHSERVAIYASEFLKFFGSEMKNIEDVYFAGLLHDIGKIAIPTVFCLNPPL
ncbi:HD-GYP domain-containing protein [Nautilia sp.]